MWLLRVSDERALESGGLRAHNEESPVRMGAGHASKTPSWGDQRRVGDMGRKGWDREMRNTWMGYRGIWRLEYIIDANGGGGRLRLRLDF